MKILKGHQGCINVMFESKDGRYIVPGSDDETVRWWEKETWKCARVLKCHEPDAWCKESEFYRQYNLLSSKGKSADEALKKLMQEERRGKWDGGVKVAFETAEGELVTASGDRTIKIWRIETGECIRTLRGHEGAVVTVSESLNGKYIISGAWGREGSPGEIKIWEKRRRSVKLL